MSLKRVDSGVNLSGLINKKRQSATTERRVLVTQIRLRHPT